MVTPFNYPGWPKTPNLPAQRPVTAEFRGLIAFAYNRAEKRAEIVFNSGDQRHNLEITAREGNEKFEFPNPTSISLGVEGQRAGVYFLEQQSPNNSDFGFLIDLNDPRFYPGKTPQQAFGVKLIVTQGSFYTSKLTKFAFAKVRVPRFNLPFPPRFEEPLGKLAEFVSVDFELTGTQQVTLTVNGQSTRFPTQPGRTTEIVFDNECRENGKLCKHSPGNLFESLRNDFHFHRGILDLSVGDPRFGLEVAKGQLTPDGKDPVTNRKPDSSDDAPCMGSGYGDSNGLP